MSVERCEPLLTPRRAALLTLIAWIAVRMCVPLHLVGSTAELMQRLQDVLGPRLPDPIWLAIAGRVVCFVPVGLLLAAGRSTGRLAGPMLLGGLIVAALEAAQAGFVGRHPRLFDLTVGLVAVCTGVVLAPRVAPALARRAARADSRAVRIRLLIAAEALLVAAIIQAHRGVGLSGWDPRYPLLIGNEETLDRPWRGQIALACFYNRPLSASQIEKLSRLRFSQPRRLELAAAPLAAYDFRHMRDRRVRPLMFPGPALILRIPDEPGWERTGFGLRCPGHGVTRNKGRATALIVPLIARGGLSVETFIRPADLNQSGPARIVSLSRSPSLRNFTIGQQHDRIAVRIRTPRTGVNGAAIRCWSKPVLRAGEPTHIVATFGNGTLRIFIDGREARRPLHLYRASCLILRNDHPAAGILLALLIGWPLGMLAGGIVPRDRRILRAAAAASLVPILTSLILSAGLQRAADVPFVVALPVAAALGAWAVPGRRPA